VIFRDVYRRLVGLSVLLALLLSVPAAVSDAQVGTILYVRAGATDANTGTSWANAFTDLQDALAAASAGTEIWVAAGTYYPIMPANPADVTASEREVTFRLASGVALYGGFVGSETSRAARDPATNVTILSGDIDRNDTPDLGNTASNSYNVVSGSGTDATAILDGFTISGGNASPDLFTLTEGRNLGGGVFNRAGSPTLRNLVIQGNQAEFGGGIANIEASNPALTDITITGNAAFDSGGGVYNAANSNPTLTRVSITGNRASDQFRGGGGGVYNLGSSPQFIGVEISGNTVVNVGGGVYNLEGSSPTFTNSTISGNLAAFTDGAGIYNFTNSSPSLSNSTIADNVGSGIYNFGESNATLTNVIITRNQGIGAHNVASDPTFTTVTITDNQDRGVYNVNSNAAFTDATITGNQYDGVYNETSSPIFTNSTISNNQGWGVYNYDNGDATFTDVTISGNQPDGNRLGSGGVYSWYSSPIFVNVRITDNVSNGSGAGVLNERGTAVLQNVTIANNTANDNGGGMYNEDSRVVLLNVEMTGNRGEQGGGIYNFSSIVLVTNALIAGNRAASEGGGVHDTLGSETTFTNVTIAGNQAVFGGGLFTYVSTAQVRSSIIWGNAAGTGAQIGIGESEGNPPSVLLFDHSLVQGVNLTGERTGNLDGSNAANDPQFVAPVLPELAPTSQGDYRLQAGSPLIDAGARIFLDETQDNVPDVNGDGDEQDVVEASDLAGNPRVAGAEVDLGAYETGSAPPVTITENGATTRITPDIADSYTISLASPPAADVVITAQASGTLAISSDGVTFGSQASMTFTPATWNVPQRITVRFADNGPRESGQTTGRITHQVSSTDPTYNGVAIPPVDVAITVPGETVSTVYLPFVQR
jgi:hypothetical protein